MNQADYFSGSVHFGLSVDANGNPTFANSLLLVPSEVLKEALGAEDFSPQFYTEPAPVVVNSYEIFQQAGGTALFLLFFDSLSLPPDATALDGAPGLKFIQDLAAGKTFFWNVSGPGHRYNQALGIIASTSSTTVTRATGSCLFSVTYSSYRAG